jgi:hypothetical protein
MTNLRIQFATLACMLVSGISTVWASPQSDLWRAAEMADQAVLARSLQAGAKVNATDEDGWSALLFATTSGDLAVVSRLLAEHADPNLASKDGQTPLMGAIVGGNPAVVKALLAAGAHANSRLPTGKTAADLARSKGRMDLAELLVKGETRELSKAETAPPVQEVSPVSVAKQTGGGVDPETIRTFLLEESKLEQKREDIKQRQVAAAQGIAAENRRQAEIVQAAQQRYSDCLSRIEQCKQNCRDAGTGEMLGAAVGGVLLGSAGVSTGTAQTALIDSATRADSCVANCDATSNCEALRPR